MKWGARIDDDADDEAVAINGLEGANIRMFITCGCIR